MVVTSVQQCGHDFAGLEVTHLLGGPFHPRQIHQIAQRPVVGQDGRRPRQTHGPAEAQKAQEVLAATKNAHGEAVEDGNIL